MLCNESKICSDCNETEYHELDILQTVHDLSVALGNDQCSEAILQFFCKATNLIDVDNYTVTLIEGCSQVRDDECAAEWRIAENFFNVSLPDCSSFDTDTNFTTARAPVLGCPDDFGVFCGSICQPLCDEISIFNDAATAAYKILNITFHTMSLIGGVITFLACCLRKKKMYVTIMYLLYNRCSKCLASYMYTFRWFYIILAGLYL